MTSLDRDGSTLADTIEVTEEFDFDLTIELTPDSDAAGSNAVALRPVDVATGVTVDGVGVGAVLCSRYVLGPALGNGGTALVSCARDLWRDEAGGNRANVAIKRLRPELRDRPGSIARLRREFAQTRALAHPNIVKFYDFNCDRGTWFISMELLAGEALGDRLRRTESPGLPAGEALRIASACGDALEFAHRHGVTHGDIKPDNVFVTATEEVRVLDFGVAASSPQLAAAADAVPEHVAPAGTRAYSSPEVLEGRGPEPRDDVFSLACVIYEMLSGRHPYGRRGANEARDAGLVIERLPGLSDRQWHALSTSLSWDRARRPPDVRELLSGLAAEASRAVAVRQTTRLPVALPPRAAKRRSRRYTWRSAAAFVGLVVLGVVSGTVGFESEGGAESASPALAAVTPLRKVNAADVVTALPAAAPVVVVSAPPVIARHPPPAPISFESASIEVSRHAVAVAIPVRRTDGSARQIRAAWRATDGTALAGRDYRGPLSGTTRFAEGQTVSIIYVPIVADPAAVGERSFTIDLTGANASSNAATQRRIIVTILDDR